MILFIIGLVLLCLLIPAMIAGSSLAPWLPSHDDDVEAALELASAQPGETFYDLGCGDGRTLIVAARHGLHAVGVELSPVPYFAAKIRLALARHRGELKGEVAVKLGDLFKADISKADIIFVYGLGPALRGPFARKLEREAKPGARVVSCHIHIRAWQEKAIGYSKERNKPLYLYDVPRPE